MEALHVACLSEAEQEGRFESVPCTYHSIETFEHGQACYQICTEEPEKVGRSSLAATFSERLPTRPPGPHVVATSSPARTGLFRCLFQGSRPEHVSGRSDSLPFRDKHSLQSFFRDFDLPLSYLQIADGSLGVAHAQTTTDGSKRTTKYTFIAHCTFKRGDWAMALSHDRTRKCTSLFWSVDNRVNVRSITQNLEHLKEFAFHPVLAPCIMFNELLRVALERRRAIKKKIAILEETVGRLTMSTSPWSHNRTVSTSGLQDIEHLIKLLNSCRSEQISREGRYHLWTSVHNAIQVGFAYAEKALDHVPQPVFLKAHCELQDWTALSWRRLESLIARDVDHVSRVDNVSNTLYNLIHQRDSRIQLEIARASQRDSEDMKFLALLGSVFLPAGLIAVSAWS
ncbi:hypothetical protein BAUCODRAFT_31545 [Baudoinia panamericana UAMH 10762]|uniref:Uncharacterized protein n=1 Tax=Baudoinia panamericana (strain UAMH 10762) TaxID=717646 RepID=M2N5A4_BAUPA|nr:uncharacterized protein BAUCODRAFT_31545 [Baudoinia panamericana UAMH 10762]EMC99208.1 hypothetical protein BAUCODRAFT_31545 [Baudoinia panamericana UAMH 10762]